MRALVVEVENQGGDLGAGVAKSAEERLVEKFAAHAAVEALAEGILHWLARRDDMPGDALGREPGEHGVRRKLSAVIGDNHAWSTPSRHERRQFAHDPLAGDRRFGDREQAFAGRVVDHVQDAEAPPWL